MRESAGCQPGCQGAMLVITCRDCHRRHIVRAKDWHGDWWSATSTFEEAHMEHDITWDRPCDLGQAMESV